MEYNEFGYIAGSPLGAASWRQICPREPSGLVVTQGAVPPGILVFQNYLPPQLCERLKEECEAIEGFEGSVLNQTAEDTVATQMTPERVCEILLIDKLKLDVSALVRRAFTEIVGPHFRMNIEAYEKPDILRYRAGGEYKTHADADNWFPAERAWQRVVDRDVSLLLYFNQNYEGGELMFPNFGSGFAPRSGMLVAFPSDHRYVHGAQPVKSGIRYAIVSWAMARGSARVEDPPRPRIRI